MKGLRSKNSITPLSLGASCLCNPCEYSHKPYITDSRLIDLHFAADSLLLASFSFVLVSSVRRFYFGIIGDGGVSAVLGHPMSLILVPIESAYATSY